MATVLKQDKSNLSNFGQAVAGSAAAFFSSIVVCPTEMVKARMQSAQELSKTGKFNFSGKVTILSTSRQILSEVSLFILKNRQSKEIFIFRAAEDNL